MNTGYEVLRQRHQADAMAQLPEHFARIAWPRERLFVQREQSLRVLIDVAQRQSSWHRDRLGHLNARTLREADLAGIPAMTKQELMTNFDSIVTDRRLNLDLLEKYLAELRSDEYLFDRYHVVTSGGSSGRRGVFVYDWDAWTLCYLSLRRYSSLKIAQAGRASDEPIVMAKIGAAKALHISRALSQTFSNPNLIIHHFPMTLAMEEIVEGLNALQPDLLEGYTSVLFRLAKLALAGKLRIAPRWVSSISEPLLPEIRKTAEEAWKVTVLNVWGASEAGCCAASCGLGPWMHLTDDLLLIEPVDDGGHPVPAGVRSAKVYLTNLYNLTVPLIRYELTDEVTLIEGPCPCGSHHRRIEDVQGRLDDSFCYSGGPTVHPHLFRTALARERNVVEYQVRQTPRGATISLVCNGEIQEERLHAELVGGLTHLGLKSPEIRIARVEHLERLHSGKLKRFVPLS
jgi:phenylacetate-CoA ligase